MSLTLRLQDLSNIRKMIGLKWMFLRITVFRCCPKWQAGAYNGTITTDEGRKQVCAKAWIALP